MPAPLLLFLAQVAPPPAGPPGLVLIPGGRTRMGLSPSALERMLERDATLRPFAGALAAETPEFDADVPTFWLMPTEVTSEQYAAYLEATGERAPEPWCEEAIRAASEDHARRAAEAAEEARKHGLPPPELAAFDAHAWWLANGRGARWRLPAEERATPVVFVSWDEARAYARWAGLRLPSEPEHVRAARGDTSWPWPWGTDVRAERYAATADSGRTGRALAVGSFPGGATRQGVLDLVGNVWEWTSSAYTAFPGHEPREWVFGYGNARQRVTAIPAFDPAQRVAIGGSFQNPLSLCRSTVRLGLVTEQRTGAVGFRCAASARPGVDLARAAAEAELATGRMAISGGPLPRFAPELAVAADGWRTQPVQGPEGWTAPAGYAVIAEHRSVLFAPVERAPVRDPQTLDKVSVEGAPTVLGFLHTTVPLEDPVLEAGTYVVAWRAKGLRKLGGDGPRPKGAPLEELLALDTTRDNAILCDTDGRPLAALPWGLEWTTERDGRVSVMPPGENAAPGRRLLFFEAWVPSETTKRGFVLTFEVTALTPDPDVAWR